MERYPSRHPDAEDIGRALPAWGALGRTSATVTSHPNVKLGRGWRRFPETALGSALDSNVSGSNADSASDSVAIVRERVVSSDVDDVSYSPPVVTKNRVHAFPSYVSVTPIACLGGPFTIAGLRGGERVHVFGQNASPIAVAVPADGSMTSIDVVPPALLVGTVGSPGIVPGFVYAQVLAPGQPASASEFVKVLLVDDPAVALELDAMRRGSAPDFGAGEAAGEFAGGGRTPRRRHGRRSFVSTDRISAAFACFPSSARRLPPIPGFASECAFERFASDLGALLENHWRSLLYTPRCRAACAVMRANFLRIFPEEACPRMHALLRDIAEDVDAQALRERDDRVSSSSSRSENSSEPSSRRNLRNRATVLDNLHRLHRIHRLHRLRFRLLHRPVSAWSRTAWRGARRSFAEAAAVREAASALWSAAFDGTSEIAGRLHAGDARFPMTRDARFAMYVRFTAAVTSFVLVGTFRADEWRLKPSEFIGSYAFFAPFPALFCAASRDLRARRWALGRSWMMGPHGWFFDDAGSGSGSIPSRATMRRASNHSAYFDWLALLTLVSCNGILRVRHFARAAAEGSGGAPKRWITGPLCAVGIAATYAVFTAENVPPSAKRRDIPVATLVAAVAYSAPFPIWWTFFETGSFSFEDVAAPYGRFVSWLAWLCLLPAAVAAVTRRVYRAQRRLSMYRAKAEKTR
jgi:hypothetical protein